MSTNDRSPATHENRPRNRFALLDLLLVITVLAALLALGGQLGAVGVALVCFAAAMAWGWRRGDRRHVAGGACGLVIFLTTYGACWIRFADDRLSMDHELRLRSFRLRMFQRELDDYREQNGHYPESLSRLPLTGSIPGAQFDYERRGDSYYLVDLGYDKKPGGSGIDEDLALHEGRPHISRLTLWQLLFEEPFSGALFVVAAAASFIGGSVCYGVQEIEGASWRKRLFMWGTTIAATLIIAVVLAGIEVLLSQSGH